MQKGQHNGSSAPPRLGSSQSWEALQQPILSSLQLQVGLRMVTNKAGTMPCMPWQAFLLSPPMTKHTAAP